ncbi:BRCT domain-containing protein [Pseudomonas helleri]|uniref:NAD-dependent DNA ligase n=1 Tax=Pseudomonas helleri TaxID=1608996 RepID=A0A6I1WP30_9PSED|nr:BRCT domain-containing protein [Pseudomonas helleri]MQU43097.1 NAD-dependent DNA ligase [Pseudomonas helleri]
MVDLHQEFQKSRFFHEDRIDRRSADALVGLAAGIVSDGVVTLKEAVFLEDWISKNLLHLEDPVVNILYRRLSSMLSDGVLDADESKELLAILQNFSNLSFGQNKSLSAEGKQSFSAPNDLPFNMPVPEVIWQERLFVFTGVMAYGPRKDCQALIEERGGLIGGGINKKTNYLVVGSIGNDQWRHSSYGLKIMRAVELRESGSSIAIIGEHAWQKAIFG